MSSKEATTVTLQTQLCSGLTVVPITRDQIAIELLLVQFRAAGITGDVRIIDETSGAVVSRFPLDEEPEEGDCRQPLPAA
jgi:hypothetical protein